MWKIAVNRYRDDRLHPVKIMLRIMQINLYLQALNAALCPSSTIPDQRQSKDT